MKIKKPVVGDVVIYGDCVAIVSGLNASALCIDLLVFPNERDRHGYVATEIHLCIQYPEWQYPKQTDEMIEVDDE